MANKYEYYLLTYLLISSDHTQTPFDVATPNGWNVAWNPAGGGGLPLIYPFLKTDALTSGFI